MLSKSHACQCKTAPALGCPLRKDALSLGELFQQVVYRDEKLLKQLVDPSSRLHRAGSAGVNEKGGPVRHSLRSWRLRVSLSAAGPVKRSS